jgi:saccharopine dehydrogenase (NAD+, L-lysine-forming)
MKDNILIIGGYGKVGRMISKNLAQFFPKKIIVAGRSFKKAKQLSEELNDIVIPYQLDISNQKDNEILENAKLVIMCIDQKDTKFVELCLEKGIHYMDITANHDFIDQVELLDHKAKSNYTTIALSIGLAPGITNLLVQHCVKEFSEINLISIFILLGIGEKHGEAAYRWTLDNIHSSYRIYNNGQTKDIESFSLPRSCDLIGNRKFYTFNFSDQHTIARTIGAKQVLTRMAFDSKILTSLIALLRKSGLTYIFSFKIIQNVLIRFFKKMNIGSDLFAVKVEVENAKKEIFECGFKGNGEAKITAFVVIEVALYIMQNNLPGGVKHIHQLIENIPDFLENLKRFDNTFEIKYQNTHGNG